MQWRGAATNRITDVIESLQLVRKSGVLKIERGESKARLEEGTITFVDGQIVAAYLGQLSGPPALTVLKSWGPCRFTFLPSIPQEAPSTRTAPKAEQPSAQRIPSNHARSAPYRLQAVTTILPTFETMGLTRIHRRLFLLIDGQRTRIELAQLLGYQGNEIDTLLADLERAGLIKQ